MNFNRVTLNLANSPIRRDTLHGRDYIVAPMVMLTEGVHKGSAGPLLYREAEIKKATQAWNMKPVVVYHPNSNGQGVTACDPAVLNKQQIGVVLNTRWDKDKGKLRAEAWIDTKLAETVDNRVMDALENNKQMEVSTGLYTDNGGVPGVWNKEAYSAEAINHQPDHLAVLPDQIGACSIADGAGLLTINEAAAAGGFDANRMIQHGFESMRRQVGNAMSNSAVMKKIHDEMQRKLNGSGKSCWVVDVYPKFFIYDCIDGKTTTTKLYKMNYVVTKAGEVGLDGDAVEVVRVTEYRTKEADKFVGNEAHGKERMQRKELIDGLIANKEFDEADRVDLEKLSDATLNKMFQKKTKAEADDEDEDDEEAKKPVAKNTAVAQTQNAAPEQKPITNEEYINNAPPGVRDVLKRAMAAEQRAKDACIKTITGNANNPFTPEFLATKSVDELEGLAKLASGPVSNNTNGTVSLPPMYFGQATPVGNAALTTEAPLPLPEMSWGK